MEKIEGIIDFSREEELTTEEQDKIVNAFKDEKNMKGFISCIADGNFVEFSITTKNPERPVVSFTMDFSSLVALCQDVGFDVPVSNEEPSDEEKKQIEEDAKHDEYKTYLEESKEKRIE